MLNKFLRVFSVLRVYRSADFGWYQIKPYLLVFNVCIMERVMKIMLGSHKQRVGNLWSIWSMVTSRFYASILLIYGDRANPIFPIIMMIFYQIFKEGLIVCIIINNHPYILNIICIVMGKRYPIRPLKKLYFPLFPYVTNLEHLLGWD